MGKKLLRHIGRVEEHVLCLMVLQMGISIFVQVVMRYLFHSAITWLAELVHIEVVLLTFFGASLAIKYGSHICVDVLKNTLREPLLGLLDAVNHLIIAAYAALIIFFGSTLIRLMVAHPHFTPTLRIPKHYLYFVVCIGMALIGVRSLYKSYHIFSTFLKRNPGEGSE